MNLIWFQTIGLFGCLVLAELGRYPFGGGGVSLTALDGMVALTIVTTIIWEIGIQKTPQSLRISMRPLAPFLILATLSLVVSQQWFGSLYLIRFVLYSLLAWVGYCLIKSKVITFPKVLWLIAWTGLALSLVGFVQLLIFPDMESLLEYGFDPHKYRLVASFLDPNFVGAWLVTSFSTCLLLWSTTKDRRLAIIGGTIVVAIILTFSRSAYLFFAVQLLLWGIWKFRKGLVVAGVIFLVLFLLVPRFNQRVLGGFSVDASARERLSSWNKGLVIVQSNPILGVGFNNIRDALIETNQIQTYSPDGGHSGSGVDSSLLLVAATSGLVGLLAYLYWWWRFVQQTTVPSVTMFNRILVVGLLINSQFINSLFYPPMMVVLSLWMGVTIALQKVKD